MSKLKHLKYIGVNFENAVNFLLYQCGEPPENILECYAPISKEEEQELVAVWKSAYVHVRNTFSRFIQNNPEYKVRGAFGIELVAPNGNSTGGCLTNYDFNNFIDNN